MQWLKKLFRQKKTLEEVKLWLSEEQGKQAQEQQQIVEAVQKDFPEILNEAKEAVKTLEAAELKNPNIPERAKHYMKGNREHFLKITHRFIENLVAPKEAADLSQLDLLFHEYAKNSTRAGAILSEFFGEEVKSVRLSLSKIEAKVHGVKESQARKDRLGKIEAIIHRMNEAKEEKEKMQKQKTEFEEQLQQLKNKQENIRKEKEEFVTKPEYLKVKEDLVTAAKERQEAEQEITDLFLPLSDALKKYGHRLKNEKLSKYGSNPLEALIHDYSLGILKYVDEIRGAIEKSELELKPERQQKSLEALKLLTKERLGKMIHNYANSKKREADIHHEVAERAVIKEYEQYAVDLRKVKEEIEQLEGTIAKLVLPKDEEVTEELKHELEKHKLVLV